MGDESGQWTLDGVGDRAVELQVIMGEREIGLAMADLTPANVPARMIDDTPLSPDEAEPGTPP